MNIRKAAAAVACAGLATLGMAAPALADGNGATGIKDEGCHFYLRVTVCGSIQAEINRTQTPSGNTGFEENGKFDETVTPKRGYPYTLSGDFHYHQLFKSGEQQEYSEHISTTTAQGGYSSTLSADLHFANGAWQFQNIDYVCS